jgi:branched-chain amino acid transport system permease protein
VAAADLGARARGGLSAFRLSQGDGIRAVVITVLFLFALILLPAMLSDYWTDVSTNVAIYTMVTLGLCILMGRVGLVSLGQIALLAIGSWVGARLLYATGLPFPVVLLMTGLITMVIGTIIGLPALRLSGLDLALITLMLAGAITVVIAATDFPNGGGGFLGHTDAASGGSAIRRPAIAGNVTGFYRYTLVVMALMFLLALVHVRGRAGRAWAAIRQSESTALATGINVTVYKLWALALASFMTGVAGALLASDVGQLFNLQFPTQDNISLLAVCLMGGIFSIWGALVAGIFFKLLPALLDNWGLPPDLLTIIFGVGILQVLLTAPAGVVEQLPKDIARLGRLIGRLFGRARGSGHGQTAETAEPP